VKAPTVEVVVRGGGFGDLGATFVVNDDVDAALELRADGVHLGQSDPGAERARAGGLLLGRSAVTFEQAVEADADYLGVGPIWETPSKDDADPALGLDELARICESVSAPVVAIGASTSNAAAASAPARRRRRHPRGDGSGPAAGGR
jgi:thiamine-phosphate pyrophosphorylase